MYELVIPANDSLFLSGGHILKQAFPRSTLSADSWGPRPSVTVDNDCSQRPMDSVRVKSCMPCCRSVWEQVVNALRKQTIEVLTKHHVATTPYDQHDFVAWLMSQIQYEADICLSS